MADLLGCQTSRESYNGVNCIGWASALMVLVYNFMEKKVSILGQPDSEILQMRYVLAGLAIYILKIRPLHFCLKSILSQMQKMAGSLSNISTTILQNLEHSPIKIKQYMLNFCHLHNMFNFGR